MLEQLLWKQQSKRQIWGAILGTFLGLFLLLAALQLYHDVQSLTKGKAEDQFVLINKKVNIFNTLGATSAFSPEEIDTLQQQDFIQGVGKFTPNRFKVSASSSMFGFYTELFFEAVEAEYLDIQPRKFKWEVEQPEIPVIISRDYLALYNFGFAPSQGLPQFTQNTIKKVVVDINVQGNGLRQTFTGRIVGFSDRINSVLVPQNFMDWANQKFGNAQTSKISRLVLATDNPYSPDLQNFLKAKNYEVATGKLIGGQVGLVINILLGIIGIIGLIITLLSVLVFRLNFELIISKASSEMGLLMQLGYQPKQLSRVLIRQLTKIFGMVFLAAVVTFWTSRYFLSFWLQQQSFELPAHPHWTVLLAAVIIGTFFLGINQQVIRTKIKRLFI